ncbi:hypothetical protein BH18THE1_BH18THE1_08650 [soil metagenome]
MSQKYTKLDGTVSIYKVKNKKWIKSKKHYKPQKRGLEKKSIHSTRFGFLDLYNHKEQLGLLCPSGYSISQCFNVLRKLWYAYRKSIAEEDLQKMEKYAKAIQNVQEDMGIATTSFPHLGIYGDSLVLNDKKCNRIAFENHSALKQKQKEYEKWQAENSKKIQEMLQKPNENQVIVTFADDTYPFKKVKYKGTVPELLKPDEGQEILTMIDDIPFQNQIQYD